MSSITTITNQYLNKVIRLTLILILTHVAIISKAQQYAVQATTQLIPPYSVYLSDYATPGNEKLRVILIHRDISQPVFQLRLIMNVEWNGRVIMRTSRTFNPAPINLSSGIPTVISGAELAPYLDSRNIDFVGYSREQYERTRALPEGSYRISFTAYDYRRLDAQVSNEASSFHYLTKSEPPLINLPPCGTKIAMRTPQQIIFSWMPRNTSSPNSASRTSYEFALYETRPAGRNPNDIVLSTQPVFKTTTDLTQLIYGPAEPLLLENMVYVWRVRAIDENGRDAFRNNGYSEVCTFTYGGVDPTFNIGVVENLNAAGETERRAKISWKKGAYDSYKIFYKKTSGSHEWFSSEVTTASLADKSDGELKLYGLEPDTEYETRVQVKKSGVLGPYSEIVKFRTNPPRVAQCGEAVPMPQEGTKPLMNVIKGTIIDVDGIEMTILEASSSSNDGWYKGYAKVNPKVLGGASYSVKFERLFIGEDRKAGFGRIDILTKGVAAMVEEQLAAQEKRKDERQEQENREQWENTQFHDKIFTFHETVIDSVYMDPNGNLMVVDDTGQPTMIPEIPVILKDAPEKAVIIEDKNGDQWVVQKNGDGVKATRVPGGGLSSSGNVVVTDVALDIIKKALKELRREYNDSKIDELRTQMERKEAQWDQELAAQDTRYGLGDATGEALGESLFFNFQETTVSSRPSGTAKEYKGLEFEYNKALVIQLLSIDGRNEELRKEMAAGLIHESNNITVYITEQKALNKTDEEIIPIVKASITSFVGDILKKHLVFKKK
jgi:TANFOR domain-containing protein